MRNFCKRNMVIIFQRVASRWHRGRRGWGKTEQEPVMAANVAAVMWQKFDSICRYPHTPITPLFKKIIKNQNEIM